MSQQVAYGTDPVEQLPNQVQTIAAEFEDRLQGNDILGTPSIFAITTTPPPNGTPAGAEIAAGTPVVVGTQVVFQVTTVNATPDTVYWFDVRGGTTNNGNRPQAVRRLVIVQEG